jgi:hypothetical protein
MIANSPIDYCSNGITQVYVEEENEDNINYNERI